MNLMFKGKEGTWDIYYKEIMSDIKFKEKLLDFDASKINHEVRQNIFERIEDESFQP